MLAPPGWSQGGTSLTCSFNAGEPPLVRAEGLTELVGDIVMTCSTNEVTLPPGSVPPSINLQLFLNTNVTSRLITDSLTEALLLIDDPLPENHFLATGPPANTVGCTPSPECPNIFPALRAGPNSLVWAGIPVNPAPATQQRTFRITNVRANAAQLTGAISNPDIPIELNTVIRITPGGSDFVFQPIELSRNQNILPALRFSVDNPASFTGAAGITGRVTTLRFAEGFASAFKTHNCAVTPATPNPKPDDLFKVDVCRTNLLFPFVSGQAGFDTGLSIANTSTDPLWDRAGIVPRGTQLEATFNNIPPAMRIFISATNLNSGPGQFAQLLQSPGSDQFAPVQPNGFTPLLNVCPDYQTTQTCTVAWRFLATDPNVIQTFQFHVDGIVPPGTSFPETIVTTVTPKLGPTASAWNAEGSTAVPGFQGYILAQANFQMAHGFAFISDVSAQRLAQGYLSLVLDSGPAARPEAERDVAAFEGRGEQLAPIKALSRNQAVLLVDDKEQSAPRRFELTSEGYLPKRLRLGSRGPDRLSDFTITVQTNSSPAQTVGDSWLRVEQIGDTTPVNLVVTVNAEGLQPGTYAGSITATPAIPPNVAPVNIPFELVVPPSGPRVRTFGVTSAGSYAHSVVAPGEAVVIFGQGFGPAELAGLALNDGVVATEIGETRVLFDSEPAPMIYSVANQASCFVPFSVAGKKFVEMVVEYQGVASPPVRLAVSPAKPALLTSDQSGGGIGAILNQDNSFNVQKPARAGEVIQIFGIGGGQTTPPSTGGRLQTGSAEYNLAMRAVVDGVEVETNYAGPAPGLVEGVFQVNLRLPESVRGGKIPITIYFGDDLHTQPGVTVWVE
jgi:uncharacterized protein (TIGR03437 family)